VTSVKIMGVLNVTPDSFSDGGRFFATNRAIDHGLRMIHDGADIVDVGGESTRPGSLPIPVEEEVRRVVPVVTALVDRDVFVSVDTSKGRVARECLVAGARMINDVTGISDPALLEAVADFKCDVCIMHMQGTPLTMQANPSYTDVVGEVEDYLLERAELIAAQGLPAEKIWIDPGIGFGKTVEHNLALLRAIPRLASHGFPVLIGASRKGFIGRLLGNSHPAPLENREEATIAVQVLAQSLGAKMIRTHNVVGAKRAAILAEAVLGDPDPLDSRKT
jgi:dihydropteroate synthase